MANHHHIRRIERSCLDPHQGMILWDSGRFLYIFSKTKILGAVSGLPGILGFAVELPFRRHSGKSALNEDIDDKYQIKLV